MLMSIYIRNIYCTIISRVICQIYKSYNVYIHQIKLFVFNEKVKFTPKIEKNMENTLNINIFQNTFNTLLVTQLFKF